MSKFLDIWDRKNDGDRRQERSLLRWIIFSTAVFLIAICFLLHDNIFRWVSAELTIHNQKKQIERYQGQINALDKRIDDITNNKDSLEKFARETFGMSEPGEDVYIIEH